MSKAINIPNQILEVNKLKANGYLNGIRKERADWIESCEWILGLTELDAREQLQGLITKKKKEES